MDNRELAVGGNEGKEADTGQDKQRKWKIIYINSQIIKTYLGIAYFFLE